ncbi:MAG: WG repeat-containing protein [Prevotella sp.]|nr:WG repeat-containing protein [Prevotella sp.]
MDIYRHLTKNYPPYGVTKVKQNGKWGILQYSTQRMLTDFVYTELDYFMRGCAIFKKNEKYGLVYYDGTEIISNTSPIDQESLKAIIENYHSANKHDCIIIPYWFDKKNYYNDKYLYTQKIENKSTTSEKYGVFDNLGCPIIPPIYDDIYIEKECIIAYEYRHLNGKIYEGKESCSFYNCKGELLFALSDLPHHKKYEDGLFVFGDYIVNSDGVFLILIDKNGKPIDANLRINTQCLFEFESRPIPKSYIFPKVQSNGTIVCRRRYSPNDYGLIDLEGNLLLPFAFSSIKYLQKTDDLYQVSNSFCPSDIIRKSSYDSSEYQKLFQPKFIWQDYKKIEPFGNTSSFFLITKRDGKCGIISKKGRNVLSCDYISIESSGSNDKYIFATLPNKLCGAFDPYYFNKNIVPCNYKKITVPKNVNSYLIVTSTDDRCGVYNFLGKDLIPCEYDIIRIDISEYIVLYTNNENKRICRIYDTNNKTIMPFVFNDVIFNDYYYTKKFVENSWKPRGDKKQVALAVRKGRKWYLKDANFKDIGYFQYDDVIFEQYCVLGLVEDSHTDCCDYYGNVKSVFSTSRFRRNYYDQNYVIDDRDMGDSSWRDLGSQEEDYIINNGGDWILDT